MNNSLVSVYRKSDKKLLRIEDNTTRAIAHVVLDKLKVTPYGLQEGYFVNTESKLTLRGEPVMLSKWK